MVKQPMPAILRGDARSLPLPDESVDLVVTSPPYFGLRDYGTAAQIGAEHTPQEFIAALVECTREMVRVLKPCGSIFVNLGDKYAGGGQGGNRGGNLDGGEYLDRTTALARKVPAGMRAKSLMLLPERYRISCTDELGLIARAVIIWDKANGLPESVTDRVRRSHEDWVHLTRSPRYYESVAEIREPQNPVNVAHHARYKGKYEGSNPHRVDKGQGNFDVNPLGKLPGSVWEIATQPLRVPAELGVDHFAAFPMEWPRRLILGWSPQEVCTACGEGRRPVSTRELTHDRGGRRAQTAADVARGGSQDFRATTLGRERVVTITGYACACTPYVEHEGDEFGKPWREYRFDAPHPPTTPGVVLDPFGGTGTTALVAAMHGRQGISVDLSADYCRLAEWRAADPKERARAAGLDPDAVAKVHHQLPGQESLLDLFDGGAA